MLLAKNLNIAGHGTENVSQFGGLKHGHHLIAIHYRLQSTQGINLGDDHLSPHTVSSHGYPTAAPSVTCHHERGAGKQAISGPDDPINCTLTRTVTVVEKVFGVGVVYCNNRIGQNPFSRHAFEPNDSGGSFLCSRENVL